MNVELARPTRLNLAALALLASILALPSLSRAQTATLAMAGRSYASMGDGRVVRVDLTGGATSRTIALPAGQSATVELPVDARDVIVTAPAIADVVLRSPRQISILALTDGATDAVFFDAANRRILTLMIHVSPDTTAMNEVLSRVLPGSNVRADGVRDSVILSGQVANLAEADRAVQVARAQVGSPNNVINMLTIAGKDQVMLKVRIVEVQRNAIKQLGFNFQAMATAGTTALAYSATPTYAINGSLLGGGAAGLQTTGNGGLNQLTGIIEAFERVGLVRTLAEPNLTAVSGEAAQFLAGGEFPVPVGRDNNGEVTIDFKPYGVGLGFTPVVLSGGRISLKISTEVSELSTTGAFSLGFSNNTNSNTTTTCTTTGGTQTCTTAPSSSSGSGNSSSASGTTLVVPSLLVNRAQTVVELPSGGALMIAGLLQDTSKQDIDAVPGLKNLPVLGALFRSRDYLAGQTELVVVVTPYIVSATSPQDLQTPADGLRVANDADTIMLGRLNQTYHRPPEATTGRTYQGPVGYVIE
jgi:pilus assembly protein CpaC